MTRAFLLPFAELSKAPHYFMPMSLVLLSRHSHYISDIGSEPVKNHSALIFFRKLNAIMNDIIQKEGEHTLLGKQVVGVMNFAPKQIGPFMSECLITGFHQEYSAVVPAVPDQKVGNGAKLA